MGLSTPARTRTKRSAISRRTGRFFSRTIITALLRTSQQARRTQFESLGPPSDHVVMLGDSITEFGIWSEWFPNSPIANRGVGGETSAQVLTRLQSAIDKPRAVFLLIGTNDLMFDVPHAEIEHNVASILRAIEHAAPSAPVVLQSVMPRALAFRDEIIALNRRLRELAEAAPDHVRYLDLWAALATPTGALRPEFTEDKLHLSGDGYRAWVGVLQPVMAELSAA